MVLLLLMPVQLGSTTIGLKTKDGVILAVEKRVTSPLLVIAVKLSNCVIANVLLIMMIGAISY